jgi:hypothetical protein
VQSRDDLRSASDQVERLKNFAMKPTEAGPIRTSLQRILNDASDKGIQSEALVEQGELAWALATFPELPAATTDRSLRPEKERPELLREAREAYQKVVDGYGDSPQSVAAARFGLAAIAENERKWDDAKAQYGAIAAMGEATSESNRKLAESKLKTLDELRKPVLIGEVPEKPELPPIEPEPATTPATGPATTSATTNATAPAAIKSPAATTRPSGATTRPSAATTRPSGATTRPSATKPK